MVFSRYAGAGPLEWLLPAPRRAVLILELRFACDTRFADYKLSCWAARRPERCRNVLQLAALSSLQVDCITRFFCCQVVFFGFCRLFPLSRGSASFRRCPLDSLKYSTRFCDYQPLFQNFFFPPSSPFAAYNV